MAWYGYEYEYGYGYAFLTKCVAGICFLVRKTGRQLALAAAFTLYINIFVPLPPPQKHD